MDLLAVTKEQFFSWLDEYNLKKPEVIDKQSWAKREGPLTLSREAAADKIGIKISKIDRLIKSGQLKAVKIGRNVRIKPEAIESFLNRK